MAKRYYLILHYLEYYLLDFRRNIKRNDNPNTTFECIIILLAFTIFWGAICWVLTSVFHINVDETINSPMYSVARMNRTIQMAIVSVFVAASFFISDKIYYLGQKEYLKDHDHEPFYNKKGDIMNDIEMYEEKLAIINNILDTINKVAKTNGWEEKFKDEIKYLEDEIDLYSGKLDEALKKSGVDKEVV